MVSGERMDRRGSRWCRRRHGGGRCEKRRCPCHAEELNVIFQLAFFHHFAVVAASKVAKLTFGVTGGVVMAGANGAAVDTVGGVVRRGVVPATRES